MQKFMWVVFITAISLKLKNKNLDFYWVTLRLKIMPFYSSFNYMF